MSPEVTGREGEGVDDYSSLGDTTVDEHTPPDTGREPSGHHKTTESPFASSVSIGTPYHDPHPVDGLSAVRRQLRERGLSAAGTDIVMASWKPGTEKQYRPHINRWIQFCGKWTIDSLHPSVTDVLNFLSVTFHRGVGYECVNTARGALSAVGIVLEGCRVGNHPLVNRFLRGVFNLRLPTPRYAETWDVAPVLQKLRTMDPLDCLSLKELTLKLVMLMALTQAARVQTLHLLMLRNISIGEDDISIWLGDNIKQCRPNFNVRVVKFGAYVEDARLCVYVTFKKYLKLTEKIRKEFVNDNGKLFISFMKPHKNVSKDTVARSG